jgi:hypothetical protein
MRGWLQFRRKRQIVSDENGLKRSARQRENVGTPALRER